MLVLRRVENGSTWRKMSRRKYRPNNKLKPHMTPDLAIKFRLYWWEVSVLTTVPALFPKGQREQVRKRGEERVRKEKKWDKGMREERGEGKPKGRSKDREQSGDGG